MTARQDVRRASPRPYLVTNIVDDADALLQGLEPAFGVADVAAVLLRLPARDERSLINIIKRVTPAVQAGGAALLLDGRADLVARSGADGAHLRGFAAFDAAHGSLQPDRIAGVGGLFTRHDAMLAAEAGTDYVMFGDPDESGHRPAFASIAERVEWWSEVFETPCVGHAATLEEVTMLVEAGADFVALGEFVWKDMKGYAAAVAAAASLQPVELV